ncbi:hypothetical protein TNCV_1000931, partial [Trichonephila clavipes]
VSDRGLLCHGFEPSTTIKNRVGQRCTLNLSRAETSSVGGGVVVRRGVPAQVSSTSLDHGSNAWSVAKSPRVAEQCDVNIQSINQSIDLHDLSHIGNGTLLFSEIFISEENSYQLIHASISMISAALETNSSVLRTDRDIR